MIVKSQEVTKLLGDYKLVLGIEIHIHVNTGCKMFCCCSTEGIYEAEPNTHNCPVCLGMPGALPVPNKEAVKKTQLLGLALNCKISKASNFDRKHYFYPDLPKGYQISQYKHPLCEGGSVELPSGNKVALERIHLEEDTAKSFHIGKDTLVDFNKSGIALIEIVTKPSIYSVDDAVEYGKQIQEIVRHLGVSEANMEKGQLRIEPNISLRTAEMEKAGGLPKYKVEVKNINSFKFMEKAIIAEIIRQREILESGNIPTQENRGYDESTGKTVLQRSKEEAHDYRYFPEPDIPPMEFGPEDIEILRKQLTTLPEKRKRELILEYGITRQEVEVLYAEHLIEFAISIIERGIDPRKVVNLLVNRPESRQKKSEEFIQIINTQNSRSKYPRINDLSQTNPIVEQVLKENPKIIAQIKNGKDSAIEFLVGQVMKCSKGKVDPTVVREIIKQKLLS